MALLKDLLEKITYEILQGDVEKEVSGVVYDSRKVTEGCMFICIEGENKILTKIEADEIEKNIIEKNLLK